LFFLTHGVGPCVKEEGCCTCPRSRGRCECARGMLEVTGTLRVFECFVVTRSRGHCVTEVFVPCLEVTKTLREGECTRGPKTLRCAHARMRERTRGPKPLRVARFPFVRGPKTRVTRCSVPEVRRHSWVSEEGALASRRRRLAAAEETCGTGDRRSEGGS